MSDLRILVVTEDAEVASAARECLSDCQDSITVQWLKNASIALARIGGGDIDILIIDGRSPAPTGLSPRELAERAREISAPVRILLIEPGENANPGLSPSAFAVLPAATWKSGLRSVLSPESAHTPPQRRDPLFPKTIGFLGVKGGVGTTTVAANIAVVLSREAPTTLIELSGRNDTLALHLSLAAAAEGPSGSHRLWPVLGCPGLRAGSARDLGAAPAGAIRETLRAAAPGARYLVLDLGSVITESSVRLLPELSALCLVLDRDILSLECGKRLMSVLVQPAVHPEGPIRTVVVHRSALACPLSMEELQNALAIPALGAIPPAADLCHAGLKTRRPIVGIEPDSLAAQNLVKIARSLVEAG